MAGSIVNEQALALHRRSPVTDLHIDTPIWLVKGRSWGERSAEGHVDLPRLRDGGVQVQVFALYVDAVRFRGRYMSRAVELLDAVYRAADACPGDMTVVTDATGIAEAQAEGRVAALLSIEGGEALEGSLAALRAFHRLGVRAVGLTWNHRNDLADGVGEADTKGGLTVFGREVVAEMNRLGMIVDVSHLSEPGFWDVLEISTQPVIASHSNAKALCGHPRNLTDAQLIALADQGGLAGINFNPPFLRDGGDADLMDVVRHIDHMAALVGPQHIALGSDFDGITKTPRGLEDVTCLPKITAALLEQGYSHEDVQAVLGENFLRVFRGVVG